MNTNKTKLLQIRLNESEFLEVKELAKLECEGNTSLLIRKLIRDYKEVKKNEI